MNRAFKFRAWNKHRRIMSDPFSIMEQPHTKDGKPIGIQLPEDLVFMEFTGRKDRNGKDVCEGDVIECEYHAGLPATVNLSSLTWRGEVVYGGDAAFHVQREDGGLYAVGYSGSAVKRWEVIGDIYSNPDLLK